VLLRPLDVWVVATLLALRLQWRSSGTDELTYPEGPYLSWYHLHSNRYALWYHYGSDPAENEETDLWSPHLTGERYNCGGISIARSALGDRHETKFRLSARAHRLSMTTRARRTRHSETPNGVCVSLACSTPTARVLLEGGLLCVLSVLPPAGGSSCSWRLNKMQSHPQGSHRAGACFLVSQGALYRASGLP
jgi:hypothetical protein